MNNLKLFTALLISLLFIQCKRDAYQIKIAFTLSDQTTHQIPKGQNFKFGYLTVPENRHDPKTQSIQIPVYIFKSRSAKPKKDPIVYTVGGPGSSTMPSAQYMRYYQYLDDRDFILIEQRGTQYAKPHLDCAEWSDAIYKLNQPSEVHSDSLLIKAALKCKKRYIDSGVDLDGYRTKEIAADINDLMKLLNIEQYNLLTISYSTKIAQVLMRDYPKKIRSVVMDSPLPLEVNYDEQSIVNLLESVDRLLSDCEKDKDCNTAFPNLKNRFFNFLRKTSKDPLVLSIKNPSTDTLEIVKLRGKDIVTVFSSISTSEVASLPLEIDKILKGNYNRLEESLFYLFEQPSNGNGIGMRLSVWCAEEYPFSSQEVINKEKESHPETMGLSPAVFEKDICEIWGVTPERKLENTRVRSKIPVLLISGEYDNETPFKWARSMQDNLENSFHIIFKAWKHTPTTNWSNNCAMRAANDFFNKPNQKPNPDCLRDLAEFKFVINP